MLWTLPNRIISHQPYLVYSNKNMIHRRVIKLAAQVPKALLLTYSVKVKLILSVYLLVSYYAMAL